MFSSPAFALSGFSAYFYFMLMPFYFLHIFFFCFHFHAMLMPFATMPPPMLSPRHYADAAAADADY